MAALWGAHDRVARDLLPVWRGREIDKTDGMLLLFDDAADAVGYALDYHQALDDAAGAADVARRPARRAGDPAREQRRRRRPRRQAARGRRPRQADRGARHVARARRPDAADRRGARSLGETRAAGALARPLADQGRGRAGRALRGRRRRGAPSRRRPTATRPIASSASATAGCRSRRSRTTCRSRRPRSSAASASSPRSSACSAATRLLTLLGMGGLGKTRLSLQVAAELMPRVSRRRLVHRPGADPRPGARRRARRRRCSTCARSPAGRCCRRSART